MGYAGKLLRAKARVIEITQLSGGYIGPMPEHENDNARM